MLIERLERTVSKASSISDEMKPHPPSVCARLPTFWVVVLVHYEILISLEYFYNAVILFYF